MCTVTVFPGPKGYILTHNRDEAPTRSPMDITRSAELICPKDTLKSGTWIASAPGGLTVCLLNGAFEKHVRAPEYRRSRGLVLLDFFESGANNAFFEEYDFTGIEPFTMLVLRQEGHLEFRWDGQQTYLRNLQADEPHFWCSATLYPSEMREKRKTVFDEWLANSVAQRTLSQDQLAEDLLHLHRTGSVGDPENDFVMNRSNRVRTVSITQVNTIGAHTVMYYFDLLNGGDGVVAKI